MTAGAPSIAIIGTGFGGIGMAIRLKQAGIESFAIYSKADDIGGVWHVNTYPGAACDVASCLYSFSFERDFDWQRTHGTQPEIATYLKRCAAKYGLGSHIHFGTEIASASFDADAALWRLVATDSRRFEAQIVVSACGLFNQPAYPEIEGAAAFRGMVFHSARWNHAFDPDGKRVAVIGTGCSAAQFVPEIVDRTERLVAFIRTPQYVVPKAEKVYSPDERQTYARFPLLRRWERLKTYVSFERRFAAQVDEDVRKTAEQGALAFLAREVTDPAKRAKLTPPYRLGCKRLIQSNTYLRALDLPKVEIVSDAIARIVPKGIVTADGALREVDAIIYGTGFKPTEYLSPMHVAGLGGRELNDAWRDGAEAYLGITVSGFPNFFMIYGPNTNTINSIVVMIEGQISYILKCIRRLAGARARYMDVRASVQARFNEELRRLLSATVWGSGCRAYFVNANGRVVTQWPRPSRVYRWLTRRVRRSDYSFTT
ncbi:MAG TPA: NAD(P)/FAD-dependent oxidoreductase [Stellaceae bacterium]|nr:NAD(P)/FAD-dependent oxidoreductase [Stellaceae bacterium]